LCGRGAASGEASERRWGSMTAIERKDGTTRDRNV
jgi:hypothetical protein